MTARKPGRLYIIHSFSGLKTESMERFVEDQTFSRKHRKTEKERQAADGRGGTGRARLRTIIPQESLVLCTSLKAVNETRDR
jgi:hypothetical protein